MEHPSFSTFVDLGCQLRPKIFRDSHNDSDHRCINVLENHSSGYLHVHLQVQELWWQLGGKTGIRINNQGYY